MIPIYKKGSKSEPGNYRPVSVTSVCCKLLKSLIKDDIMQHLASNKPIHNSQHGFMPGRSCTSNLLAFLDKLTEAADKGIPTDVVYLDFAKAFDKVPTERLLKKVGKHGIGGRIGNWIRAWLTGRRQRVTVNGKMSGWQRVISGVPQGSVLGPVLFLIFINDLDHMATKKQLLLKFADDTKVAQQIESARDAEELQECLNKLNKWAADWGMQFNTAKCHVMHVGRNNPKHVYNMGGTILEQTEAERDIGVIVTNNLKPSQQCKKAAQTASTVLSQILRAFHFRDMHVFLRLYNQYVRPHLEFAVPAWSPWTQEDRERLEKVQQRAVKAISGLRGRTYEERLVELSLPSLEERRLEMDMAQTYRTMNCEMRNMFERADTRRPTRAASGKDKLIKKRSNNEFRKQFFSSRVVEDWNRLPDTVKEAKTTSAFKRLHRRHHRVTEAPAGETARRQLV